MCLHTIAFYAYSGHPVSFSVESFFCLKIKLIAKWFHITILNVKVCVSTEMLFCMNSLQYHLNEVDGKASAESFKNAFECYLQADIMRNEYRQSLIINFSLS